MSVKKLGEAQWQKIRDGRDFVARDKGEIGRELTNLAPPAKSALTYTNHAQLVEQKTRSINLGKTVEESSPFLATSEELHRRFKEAALAKDIFERWIKRIGWSMYHQRRIMDQIAIDKQLQYVEAMRELLYATMLKWKDQRVRLNKLSKDEFAQEIREQLKTRLEQRDTIEQRLIENRRETVAKTQQTIQNLAELRDEAFIAWKQAHRSAKSDYFTDGDWARQIKKEVIENIDAQAHLRALTTATLLATYQQAASLKIDSTPKSVDTESGTKPIIKIVPSKL